MDYRYQVDTIAELFIQLAVNDIFKNYDMNKIFCLNKNYTIHKYHFKKTYLKIKKGVLLKALMMMILIITVMLI